MNPIIPEHRLSKNQYKRKFTLKELYIALTFVPGAALTLMYNRKQQLVNQHFIERIMLAVTEVNGCDACSWVHTQMALEQGMSSEEISSFLSGGDAYIQPEEAKGIIFAQHYADTKGLPQADTFQAIMAEYGKEKAGVILSAAQVMLAGNIYGAAHSAFQSRLRGRPYADSSLGYELYIQIAGILLLPVAVLHAVYRRVRGLPNMTFSMT